MKIVLLQKSDKPIYEQIYEQIASQIFSGELEADYCLPSIRAIARELGISVITVKSAYERLETEDYIYTQAGKGCFVKRCAKTQLDDKRYAIAAEKARRDAEYYRGLGLTADEVAELIKKNWD